MTVGPACAGLPTRQFNNKNSGVNIDQNPGIPGGQGTAAPRFCGRCGAAQSAGAAFCPKCGAPVKQSGQAGPSGQGAWPPLSGSSYTQAPCRPQTQRPQHINAAPDPGGQKPDRTTKTCKTIGLVGFILLATAVAAFFLLMHIPLVGLAAAAAAVVVLFAAHRLLARRGIPVTLLLLFAALAIAFVLFVVFLPGGTRSGGSADSGVLEGGETLVIEPSGEDTVIDYGDFTLLIPGGTVSQDETLTVTKPEGLPEAFEAYEPVCPAFDVDLGELRQFDEPLEMEIPYDKSKLEDVGIEPEEAFIAVYYNEETGCWDEVPYEVDEDAGVVRLILYHLTTVKCYYSMWEGMFVYDNGSVRVMYHTGGKYGQKYATYEAAVGRTTGDKYKPQFVVDVADTAVKIMQAYKKENLPVPDYPSIYITADTNQYGTLSGRVFLAVDVYDKPKPDIEMAVNLAHELFHAAQCGVMGTADFAAVFYTDNYFWIEAAAEYMAMTKVWESMGETPANAYDPYRIDFFESSLYSGDQQHAYEAGNFIYYAQQQYAITPNQLIELADSFSGFPDRFNTFYQSTGGGLLSYYRDFLKASLSNLSDGAVKPKLSYEKNLDIKNDIQAGQNLQFTLDADSNALDDNKPIEGSGTLTFAQAYSAGFYKFTTNCDTTLTVTPDKDVMIYRFAWAGKGNLGYDLSMQAAAGQPAEIEFGKSDFILITQVSDTPGSISLKYSAVPVKADIAGQWNFESMYYIDVEGSDEFWSAFYDLFGYTKESYMAEMNASLENYMPYLYLLITKTPDDLYTAELHKPDDFIVFDDVQYTDGNLIVKGQFNNLWINLNMLVIGGRMSGIMRSQIAIGQGDEVWMGTDVLEVAFQREASVAEPSAP